MEPGVYGEHGVLSANCGRSVGFSGTVVFSRYCGKHHNPNPLICIMKTTIPSDYSNKEVIIYSNYLPINIYRIIICILCTRHAMNVLSHFLWRNIFSKRKQR